MSYRDHNGQIVTVRSGLSDDCYIICRINPNTGGGHRIKSTPVCNTRQEAEAALASYAAKKKWQRVDTAQ